MLSDSERTFQEVSHVSTIPVSMREGHGQTLSGGDAPLAASHTDDDGKLDALIDSATETITNRDAPNGERDEILLDGPSGDGSDSWRDLKAKLDDPESLQEHGPVPELDRALKAAVDRRAGQEAESADFHRSRQWRAELEQRYDGRVAIGGLLDMFADWHERLKVNPRAAADAIASAYLDQAPHAVSHEVGQPGKPEDAARTESAGADQKLNGILDAAIDRHQGKGNGEQQAFVASARHRAALKEMFPGMSYAEACRRGSGRSRRAAQSWSARRMERSIRSSARCLPSRSSCSSGRSLSGTRCWRSARPTTCPRTSGTSP